MISETGISMAGELQKVLASHLTKAIEDSGIIHALNYCKLNAYPLTDSISKQHNATIKRLSDKFRNPLNNPEPDDMNIIQAYRDSVLKGASVRPVVLQKEDREIFYAPIMISSPLCLKCHGEPGKDIATEDYIAINLHYPQDRATGFRLNDLRGIWRIEFAKKSI